jgi:hypothetical protein
VIVGFILLHCFTLGAIASDLTPEYLQGRWVIDFENCESPDAEYVLFRADGAFESIRTGKVEILGFWKIVGSDLDLHMVTSPAFFGDIHPGMKDFEGVWGYYSVRMVPYNISDNAFEAIGVLEDQVRRTTAVRCP